MKQNIISKGEVELNQAEVCQALLLFGQEDRKVLMSAVSNYLKKKKGYTLKKLASSLVNNEIIVRAEIEFVQNDLGEQSLFVGKEKEPADKRGPNTVAFVRKNSGVYSELKEYLAQATNG